jgi:nucleotide-binding universal stress UspA family protein
VWANADQYQLARCLCVALPPSEIAMKIMIAYDGSRNAKLALVQTITMFRELKPQITLVAVAENPRDITAGNEDMFQEELSDLKRDLLEAQAVCEKEDVASETLLLEGDARKMLLYAAEKKVNPNMLVIARHSEEVDGGLIARSLNYFVDELDYMTFGKVSSFLARRVQCPLLILPSC